MNNGNKNMYEHYANCFQAFGFSLLGAQQLVTGKAPTSPTDQAMLKAYDKPADSGANSQTQSTPPTPSDNPFYPSGKLANTSGDVMSEKTNSEESNKPSFWDDEPVTNDGANNKPGFWDD